MMKKKISFSTYLMHLLSQGRLVFSGAEAQEALGLARGALLDAAERQQKRKLLVAPRRDFYVIVPPQFLAWGAPPPSWYIDSLMQHANRPYYVGLLKAAELHGATHHAVMEFQVVTDRQFPPTRAGRSLIRFYYRKEMEAIEGGLEDHKTETGRMKVSGLELTALDLLRYPHAAGGLDHIVTVLSDLGDRLCSEKLASISNAFERSVRQRLGHLLDTLGHREKANHLHGALLEDGRALPWVELERRRAVDRDFASQTIERDERWHLIVRRELQPDT